jgi:hypothetical protein
MRIRKIQLQNFRSHVDTTLELDRLTVIRGTNAAGKSSIEQAIEIVLASRTDSTTSDGKGSIGLIRAGESKAMITMALQQGPDNPDERILKCALNGTKRAVIVSKPDDPQYTGGQEWLEWLDLNRNLLSCLINNRYFVDLTEDEQKNVLASIILPKQYAFPPEIIANANDLGLKINWARAPFEVIDAAYDAAYKERTNINRDIKNFRMPEGDTTGHENLEEFSSMLEERRSQLQAARDKRTRMESEGKSQQQMLTQAQSRAEEARTRIAREEREIGTIESSILSKQALKEQEKLAKGESRAAQLDAELQRIDAEKEIKNKSKDAMIKLSKQPQCPTCSTPITEEMLATILGPLADEINKLTERQYQAIDERKALGNPADAVRRLEAHRQAESDLARARQRIKDDNVVLKDAEDQIDGLRSKPTHDFSEVDAEIQDLAARVAAGSSEVEKLRSAREIFNGRKRAAAEKAQLQEAHKQVERLIEYFGPEGVKAELLSNSIGAFTDQMNDVLSHWGYTCQLSIEPYTFAIMFRDGKGMPVPIALQHLSKSQRYRFAAAFQVALAVISGFKFVIVDEADIFDANGRQGLFDALFSGVLDQAIIMSTDERTEVPSVPGAVFYRLDNAAEAGTIPTTQVRKLVA